MKAIIKTASFISFIALAGCGSSSSDSISSGSACIYDASQETDSSVQWSKLINENPTKLSEFNLFQDNTNPTTNPQSRGLAYDLSVPLFTDYATKYRFVFIPPGCTAKYNQDESFEYPVGTALVKSFAMPSNTDNRGIENEDLIETRLLIKRNTGWTALPYVWNSNKSDAILDFNGAKIDSTMSHNGIENNFEYIVPDPQSCKNCHQLKLTDEGSANMIPIGPKARFLNKSYTYTAGTENQLNKWVKEGLLSDAPANLASVDLIPSFYDETDIANMTDDQLGTAAKAFLDINCGHCHRRDPNGLASNTNMHVEWTRSFELKPNDFGVCAKPISFGGDGGNGSDYIIEPGNAEQSLLVFRMDTTDGGDRMPPLGRELIHSEGVELISEWINRMPTNSNCR